MIVDGVQKTCTRRCQARILYAITCYTNNPAPEAVSLVNGLWSNLVRRLLKYKSSRFETVYTYESGMHVVVLELFYT